MLSNDAYLRLMVSTKNLQLFKGNLPNATDADFRYLKAAFSIRGATEDDTNFFKMLLIELYEINPKRITDNSAKQIAAV